MICLERNEWEIFGKQLSYYLKPPFWLSDVDSIGSLSLSNRKHVPLLQERQSQIPLSHGFKLNSLDLSIAFISLYPKFGCGYSKKWSLIK